MGTEPKRTTPGELLSKEDYPKLFEVLNESLPHAAPGVKFRVPDRTLAASPTADRLTFEYFTDAGEARCCIVRDPLASGTGIVGAFERKSIKVNGLRTLAYKVIVLGKNRGTRTTQADAESLARAAFNLQEGGAPWPS